MSDTLVQTEKSFLSVSYSVSLDMKQIQTFYCAVLSTEGDIGKVGQNTSRE